MIKWPPAPETPPSDKVKPCTCAAYGFPHRLDSGKCRELYNAQEEETADWGRYFNQHGVIDRQLHQSGMTNGDFK